MRFKNIPVTKLVTVAAYLLITVLPVLVLAGQWISEAFTNHAEAFSWIIPSERGFRLLGNSLSLALIVTFISIVLGSGLALWLTGNKPIQKIIGAIYLLPLLIPPYIHSLEWMAVAGNRQFLNQIFSLLPGMEDLSFSTYGFIPTACVLIFALFPIATLMVRRGLNAIQPEFIEVGLLSGNSWQVWRRLVLPLIFPSIIASAGLIFVLVLVEYGVPSLLQYNVYIGEVYSSFSLYFDPIRAFAAALPIILITVLLLTLSQFGLKNSPLQSRSQPIVLNTKSWPSSIRIVLLLCVVLWGITSIVPLIVLLARGGHPGLFWNTFLYNFSEIRLTVIVAAVAAVITTIIAVPLAISLTRRMSRLWWLIFALPLAIPAPLVGIAMIYIWNNPVLEWAYGTWIILVFVQAARFLPFALFAASTGVRNIDPVLIEASQLPDTGFRRRLTKVTLPLLAPTIVMTWLVSFIFALGELGATLLVAPPGQPTLPITIYNLLHYGATDTISVMSLIIVITAGIACAAAFLIYNRMLRKRT